MEKALKIVIVAFCVLGAMKSASAEDDCVRVVGKGVGTDKSRALKDAYRNAVERAVGVFVDAEQQVENDRVIADRVLTHSNAYVRKFTVVDENKDGDLFRIRILADVAVGELRKNLSSLRQQGARSVVEAGQTIHANLTTKDMRDTDACALIGNFLKDYDPIRELMTINCVVDDNSCSDPKDGKIWVWIKTKIELNVEKYVERMGKLHQLLQEISLEPPKTVRLRNDNAEVGKFRDKDEQSYLEGNVYVQNGSIHKSGVYQDRTVFRGAISDGQEMRWSTSRPSLNQGFLTPNQVFMRDCSVLKEAMEVVVVEEFNKSRSSITAKKYVVSKDVAKVINEWQRKMVDRRTVHYDAILVDVAGVEFAVQGVTLDRDCLINSTFLQKYNGSFVWFVAPFVHGDAGSWRKWISFKMQVEDLKRMSGVTFEQVD